MQNIGKGKWSDLIQVATLLNLYIRDIPPGKAFVANPE